MISPKREPAVWFLAVRTGSGADVFTERLNAELRKRGTRSEISWLPHRAEYAPWTVEVPAPPAWANVVHINTWLHSRFVPKSLPVVATLHHSIHHPDADPYKGWLRAAYHKYWIRPIERRTVRRADRVIAVSKFAAKTARETLLDRPMMVVCNGVDIERFRPSDQRYAHQPFRLLYVGKWVPLKGVGLLAPIMRELGDNFELRYTGGSKSTNRGGDFPVNMHDLGRLHSLDAVITAMQNADALIFPSRSEGFPLVVIEAMACGLPVIATRESSVVEAIDDGATGILCKRDNVTAFADAARQLFGDLVLCQQMAVEARHQVAKKFSLERMVAAYEEIYANCMCTN